MTVERPVVFRYADSVRGEIRRDVAIVPAVTVAFDETLAIVPTGAAAAQPRGVRVRVRSETLSSGPGVVRVLPPDGWRVTPAAAPITFTSRGEGASVPFTVTPPASVAPGAYTLDAQVTIGGRTFDTSMQTIDYPHIQKHRLYAPARMTARVLDLAVAPVKVGYVMGGGDRVPEAIRRLGLDVTLLTDDDLASGDLARYGTIVVGVRASESRPAFVAANARLLQFVRDGGTLIVQYQQADYTGRSLSPFPASGNVRVSDERAPVTILEPQHPAFTTPNRITGADWDDWVQERDLYAWATFDPQYTPLLETGDPGEPRQRGGQLYARIGKGHYVYTSYAWFRQLPAGVPGAYRLFANLLSLGRVTAARSASVQAQARADRVQAIVAVQAGEARIDADRIERADRRWRRRARAARTPPRCRRGRCGAQRSSRATRRGPCQRAPGAARWRGPCRRCPPRPGRSL